ncbi:MAG TPA: hypothetical protein VMT60_02620 [Candidatus Bathyarchaeia archaeon]|nr:hypothetical protein [Candidatus Bathyarchaeia archaeon]
MLRRLFPLTLAFALAVPGGLRAAPEFRLCSRTLLQGPARTVTFSGGTTLVGTGGCVAIFSEGTSLKNPVCIQSEGEPGQIVVRGSLAYVAAFSGGLEVIDLAAAGGPKKTYRYGTIQAMTCAGAGSFLYVADAESRLFVFDLANPREPRFTEMIPQPSAVYSLSAERDLVAITYQRKTFMYRADAGGKLRKLSETAYDSDAKKGILRGGFLHVLTASGTLLSWDVRAADKPFSLKPLQTKGVTDVAVGDGGGVLLTNLEYVIPFEIAGGSRSGGARLKTLKGFSILSVNNYGQSVATGSPSAPEITRATGVFAGRNRIAVLYPFDGIRLYAIEKGAGRLLDAFPTPGYAINLLAAGGLLYVANSYDGVRIGRVARDGSLDWIGHLQTGEARDIALAGKNLIIADGSKGLKTADVSDPAHPRIIARYSTPYYMSALTLAGGRAYCAGGLEGVEIVDIANPAQPSLVWREKFSEVRGIAVDDRYLYFADGDRGFRTFALGKDRPTPVSLLDTPGWNDDCFIDKNTAYLADGGRGIIVVDIADRTKPRILGSLELNTLARVVWLRGKTLFVAGHTKGVAAVDVSNPRKPTVAAWYDTVDDARGVFADGDFVYVASGSGGVYVFKYHD